MPGLRKRLALDLPSHQPSDAGTSLKRLHGTAKLSAADVGVVCAAVKSSVGFACPADVAAMGGACPKKIRTMKDGREVPDSRNSSRALQRAVAKSNSNNTSCKPPLVEIDLPLWDCDREAAIPTAVSFSLPHLILDSLPQDRLHEYCELSAAQAGVRKDLETWLARTGVDPEPPSPPIAACALWGDGAPYSTKDSLQLLVMTLISGNHSFMWWVVAFGKQVLCRCGCKGRHTYDAMWSVLAWSFRAAAAGIHPRVDHLGAAFKPGTPMAQLAGRPMRLRGALLAKRGDWQWMKAVLGLCGWKGEGPTKRICWMCEACLGGECAAYDFSSGATWRSRPIDMQKFWANQVFVSTIWGIPGFCVQFCKADWMHVACLGILQAACGSALWELFVSLGGVQSRSTSACMRLLTMFRVMSKALDVECPIGDLVVTMFRSTMSKSPKLKLKAAEGRRFLVVLRKVLASCFPLGTPHAATRFSCIDNLFLCYHEMDHWVDGGSSSANLARFGRRHLLLYCDMGRLVGEESLLWPLYPKHHVFGHLAGEADTNPKRNWNYAMESEIGNASAVAARASKKHLHRVLLQRHANAM